jgi:HEAT repeat protein
MTAKIVIGSVLAVFIVIVGLLIVNKIEDSKRAARYNEIIAVASEPTTKEIEVDEEDLQILLDSIRVGTNRSRQIVYKALSIAKGQPGMDVSASIAEFATTGILPDEIRAVLLGDVLRIRKDRSVLPFLFDYIEKTENEKVASAALRAAESVATDSEIQNFLQLIQLTPSNMIRRSAEDAAVSALEFSRKPKSYGGDFVEAMEAAVNADVRHAMIRLMGQTGAEVAADTLVETLNGKDRYDAIAALQGIAAWPNDELYPELVSFLDGQADELVRRKTFEAAISILIDPERRKERSETQQREMWTSLQRATTTTKEMFTLLSGLARVESASWAVDIAQTVANQSGNADVKAQAEGAIQRMKERAKLEGK